jgi:hypothetical protein
MQQTKLTHNGEELIFNFAKITGNDILNIERGLIAEGLYKPSYDNFVFNSTDFLVRLASRAANTSIEFIQDLPPAKFFGLLADVKNFLLFGADEIVT